MSYELVFTPAARQALTTLEKAGQQQIRAKLDEIAANQFRHPTDWDFVRLPGPVDGRFRVGNSLRVAADIDESAGVIRIRDIAQRENLYT